MGVSHIGNYASVLYLIKPNLHRNYVKSINKEKLSTTSKPLIKGRIFKLGRNL